MFQWNETCEQAFNSLKKAFCEIVTLKFPNFSRPFIFDTDASDVGIGAVLFQLNKVNVEQPVGYYSCSLSKSERKYGVTRTEMLALFEALRHFRSYLLGKKYKVRTDHSALQWLRTFKEPVGQVARLIERLAEYDFDIVHLPGKQHTNSDALSRYPHTVISISSIEHWLRPQFKNEFRKNQANDFITSSLLLWIKKAVRPYANDFEGASRELKYYWTRFNELTVQDGIFGIQKSIDDGSTQIFCAIVHQATKKEFLEQAHGSFSGGHFGVQTTRETTSAFSLGANVQRC